MKKKSRLGSIVWILLGFLILGLVVRASYTDLRDYLAAPNWQTTTATRPRDNTKTAFISFQYTVDGRTYTSHRAYFFQSLVIGRESEELKDRYPVGSEFTVYYDPAHPQRAVIHRDLQWQRLLWWILAVSCFGVIALLFFIFRLKTRFIQA